MTSCGCCNKLAQGSLQRGCVTRIDVWLFSVRYTLVLSVHTCIVGIVLSTFGFLTVLVGGPVISSRTRFLRTLLLNSFMVVWMVGNVGLLWLCLRLCRNVYNRYISGLVHPSASQTNNSVSKSTVSSPRFNTITRSQPQATRVNQSKPRRL